MRKITNFSVFFVLVCLFMLAGSPSHAASYKEMRDRAAFGGMPVLSSDDEVSFDQAQLVPASEMAEMRGGFIDPSGLIFRFAVDVKSQIDGVLTFVRSLVLQANEITGQMHAESKAELVTEPSLPSGTTAHIVNDGAGVVVKHEQGQQTTVINQAASGAITNVVMNTADNVQVAQTINIDLVLQNVGDLVGQVSAARGMVSAAGLHHAGHMHRIGFGF